MPVYNPHPVYFRQAIESILNQTLQDWELVIVEDPSPNPASEILKDYPDPRIRHFVNPKRTSFVEQLNCCLQNAHAELAARQDADDISEPERLEKQVTFMQKNFEITVLGTQLAIIDEKGWLLGYRCYPCDHENIVKTMRLYNPIAHPSVMFWRKAILEKGGYQHDEWHPVEDYELWCRLAKKGAKFANLPEALVRYRVHTESSTKGEKLRHTLRNTIEIKRFYWSREMDMKARLRLLAEHLLLLLPPRLVVRLFLKTQIKPNLCHWG